MYGDERRRRVAGLVAEAKTILSEKSLSRDAIAEIAGRLEALAAGRHLWSESDFPSPTESEREAIYLVSEEADRSFALYLSLKHPGRRVPPHNHTTWACIAAVDGCEHNFLYERLDDRTIPGQARLRENSVIRVEQGRTIALMPDDIHAVENMGAPMTRHLHFYGRALETLSERLIFDVAAGTCKPMVMAAPARRR